MFSINRYLVVAVVAGFIASPLAQAGWKDHPVLEAADVAAKNAITELEAAPTDFHGHRAAAIKSLHVAMKQMQICANSKTQPASSPRRALASYPRMEAAKTALTNALSYIKAAAHDFNGHRAEAQTAIENALTQVNTCLANG